MKPDVKGKSNIEERLQGAEMLTPGDKVKLYYYEEEGQVATYDWLVEQYDNGLLRVSKPAVETEEELVGSVIFNLRGIGFLKAELIE